MNLRTADKSDIDELVRQRLDYLHLEYGEMSEDLLNKIKSQLPKFYEKHLNDDFFAYIAEENGHIYSSVFLLVQEKPANQLFATGKTGLILNVFTDERYRHHGFATTLLNQVIAKSKELDLSYLELTATDEGRPLYRKLNFVPKVPRHPEMILELQ